MEQVRMPISELEAFLTENKILIKRLSTICGGYIIIKEILVSKIASISFLFEKGIQINTFMWLLEYLLLFYVIVPIF